MTGIKADAHSAKDNYAETGLKDELEESAPTLTVQRKVGVSRRALAFVGAMVVLMLMMLAALFRSVPEKKREESVQRIATPSGPSLPFDARMRAGGTGASNPGARAAGAWGTDGADSAAGGSAAFGSNAGAVDQGGSARQYGRGGGGSFGSGASAGGSFASGSGSGLGAGAAGMDLVDHQRALYDAETQALEAALRGGPGVIPMTDAAGTPERDGGGVRAVGVSRTNGRGSSASGSGYASSGALYGEAGAAAGVQGSAGRAGTTGRNARGSRAADRQAGAASGERQAAAAARRQARLEQRLPERETAEERESREQQEALASQRRLADRLLSAGMGSGAGGGAGGGVQAGDSRLPAQRAGDGPSSAQFLSEPDMLLARGSYIRCVLETRIITDLEGFASCVTAEPIYSTNGRRLLIPQGSKVLGSYAAGVGAGHRIAVLWDRVMTPNGIDIVMESPGVDTLGGAGHPGQYDAHWASRTGAAFFISLFSDAFKYYGEKHGPKTVTHTGMGGVTVQPFQSNTARTMESVANEAVQDGLSRPPTVTLNQGTVISIYVAKDVDFSSVLPRGATRQVGAVR